MVFRRRCCWRPTGWSTRPSRTGRPYFAKKGDAKKSTSETRNYEAFAPWLSLSTSIVFLLIAVQHANWGNVWCVSATNLYVTCPAMAFLGNDNQVSQFEEG